MVDDSATVDVGLKSLISAEQQYIASKEVMDGQEKSASLKPTPP